MLWDRLREPEKWQVGQSYAEVNSSGDRAASTGLKKALLKVHGFDFVPETLRSATFTETAARVLSAHYGYNNFFTEPEPMTTLANLGTAIPRPAFAKCMEATLAVWLGNPWGHSRAASQPAARVFDGLRNEQWEYYMNECFPRDRTVLDKLAYGGKPLARWIELVSLHNLAEREIRDMRVRKLISNSAQGDTTSVERLAGAVREKAAS